MIARRPNFSQEFPTKSEFENALIDLKKLSKVMENHAESVCKKPEPKKTELKIVSSAKGRIEHVLITVPAKKKLGRFTVRGYYKRHFKRLIKALGDDREYTVVCHPGTKFIIKRWFRRKEVKVNYILSPKFTYSIWAQDAYIVLADKKGNAYLTEGVLIARRDDMTVADDVAAQSSIERLPSYLYFQGGNILKTNDYTLIGADYIWKNIGRAHLETKSKVLEGFKAELGTKNIIEVGCHLSDAYEWFENEVLSGYGFQPIFHIDMYITPTGVIDEGSEKEIIVLGSPQMAYEVTGKWSEDPVFDDCRYNDFFEQIREQLEEYFTVIRIPLLLTRGNLGGKAPKSKYYNLSFNNVIIENDGVNKNVIIPTYSGDSRIFGSNRRLRKKLENASKKVWESLGFKVHLMDAMEDLAYQEGSVHCIVKILKRTKGK